MEWRELLSELKNIILNFIPSVSYRLSTGCYRDYGLKRFIDGTLKPTSFALAKAAIHNRPELAKALAHSGINVLDNNCLVAVIASTHNHIDIIKVIVDSISTQQKLVLIEKTIKSDNSVVLNHFDRTEPSIIQSYIDTCGIKPGIFPQETIDILLKYQFKDVDNILELAEFYATSGKLEILVKLDRKFKLGMDLSVQKCAAVRKSLKVYKYFDSIYKFVPNNEVIEAAFKAGKAEIVAYLLEQVEPTEQLYDILVTCSSNNPETFLLLHKYFTNFCDIRYLCKSIIEFDRDFTDSVYQWVRKSLNGLELAAYNGDFELVRKYHKHHDSNSAFILAAHNKHKTVYEFLYPYCDINVLKYFVSIFDDAMLYKIVKNNPTSNCIMNLVSRNRVSVILELLKNNKNLARSIAFSASIYSNIPILKALLDDDYNITMDYAHNINVVKELLDAGISPIDENGLLCNGTVDIYNLLLTHPSVTDAIIESTLNKTFRLISVLNHPRVAKLATNKYYYRATHEYMIENKINKL